MIFNVFKPTQLEDLDKRKGSPVGKGDTINIYEHGHIYANRTFSNIIIIGSNILGEFQMIAEREA